MNWVIALVWLIHQFSIQSCFHITKGLNNQKIWAMMILWPCMNCTVSNRFYVIIFFNFNNTLHLTVRNGVFTDEDETTPKEEDEIERYSQTTSTRRSISTTIEAKTTTIIRDTTTEPISTEKSRSVETTTVSWKETTSNSDCVARSQVMSL